MKQIKVYFILLLLNICSIGFCFAQINIQDAIFPVTQDEQAYLYYLTYTNKYDTAFVTNQVGEFRIVNNNSESRINIIRPQVKDNYWQGDSALGDDLILMNKSRTESFLYDSNASISFFRELSVGVFCDKANPYPTNEEMNELGWLDKCFVVGKGRISDKTEFLTQLVRVSDNEVLFVVDSVGIDTNPNIIVASRYGTEPNLINHNFVLPNQFAGTEMYLRILPRRWGTTNFGMNLSINPSWVSLSTIKEYDSSSAYCDQKATEAELFSLDSLHFQNLLNHCDSIKSQTGFLPIGTIARKLMQGNQHYQVIYYYYDSAYYNGNKYYFEKNIEQGGANSVEEKFLNDINDRDFFKIQNIFPMPVNSELINIGIYSKENIEAFIEFTDNKGGFISRTERFSVSSGASVIQKNINLYPGFYYLIVKSADNKILDYRKILVQ